MKEQDIQRKIVKALEARGAWTVKTITCNKSGVPDILAVLDGRMVAVEVKTPTGRVAPLQEYQMDKIRQAGGIAGVCRGLADLDALLQ